MVDEKYIQTNIRPDDDKILKILLIIFLFIVGIGGFCPKKDTKLFTFFFKILRNIFTKQIFSKANFDKDYNLKFKMDINDFLKSTEKLRKKQKNDIANCLKDFIPSFNHSATPNELKRYVQELSYNQRKKFDKFLSAMGFLFKMYNIVCELVVLMLDKHFHIPTKNILVDFIDVLDIIDNPQLELVNFKQVLSDLTELDKDDYIKSADKIRNTLLELWRNKQFVNFVNNYIEAKKTTFLYLPMPPEFNIKRLKTLYIEMSKQNYFECCKEDIFANIFDSGIEDGVCIVWKNKNQYEFNFFILELYKTTYQMLDETIKSNVPKLFRYRNNVPLKLNNTNNEDSDEQRVAKRNAIKKIIKKCRKIVEKVSNIRRKA